MLAFYKWIDRSWLAATFKHKNSKTISTRNARKQWKSSVHSSSNQWKKSKKWWWLRRRQSLLIRPNRYWPFIESSNLNVSSNYPDSGIVFIAAAWFNGLVCTNAIQVADCSVYNFRPSASVRYVYRYEYSSENTASFICECGTRKKWQIKNARRMLAHYLSIFILWFVLPRP